MATLAPSEELTRRVSSSTTSTPDVILAATVFKCILAKESKVDSGIETMKKTILEAFWKNDSARRSWIAIHLAHCWTQDIKTGETVHLLHYITYYLLLFLSQTHQQYTAN